MKATDIGVGSNLSTMSQDLYHKQQTRRKIDGNPNYTSYHLPIPLPD